jgi:hypothetical protein
MVDLVDDHYALDLRRARELLNWNPRHSLRETPRVRQTALAFQTERAYELLLTLTSYE